MLAEDILLLLTDDHSGRALLDSSQFDLVLGGAILVELAERNKVAVHPKQGAFGSAKVQVLDTSPLGDEVLDGALFRLASKPQHTASTVLPQLAKGARPVLLRRLTERGILRAEQNRVLGIFPTTRWPAQDATHEAAVRRGLVEVLQGARSPDERQVATISLLHAVNRVPQVLPEAGLDRRELRRRAKAVAEGELAGAAVREAVAAAAATIAAVVAATAAAGSSGN